jgi:hypothetical protein
MLRFAVSIAVICGFLWVLPATAEPVFVPGSQVGLVPPPGFIPSDTFKGFLSPQESGSILIIEMPAQAYDQVSGVSDAAWASKGIAVQSRTVLSIDGARAVLIKGRQNYSGVAFKKWMMIIGFDDLTAMVTAQIPETVPRERQAAIDSSLGTIQRRAALTLDQKIAALPFNIGATDNFRVANVVAGNTILLTRGPKNIVEGAEQPMLIIARSITRALAEGITAEKVSRHTIRNIASLGDIAIERTGNVRFASGDGFEIVARARVTKTNEPVAVIQWVKMLDDGYLRIIGISGTATRAADFTAFRKIRDSIRAR